MESTELLAPVRIGSRTIVNRMAAILPVTNGAGDLLPTPAMLAGYRRLAAGGWGLLALETTAVCPDGRDHPAQLGLARDSFTAFRRLMDVVRNDNPELTVVARLGHAGRGGPGSTDTNSEMGDEQIRLLAEDFVFAAEQAMAAGVDGVELVVAERQLLINLIRPRNDRTGMYGGAFENRVRFFVEVVRRIRAAVRKPFLVGAHVSVFEGLRGGVGTAGADELLEDFTEPLRFAQVARREGVDYLTVAQGTVALSPLRGDADELVRQAAGVFRYTREMERTGVRTIGTGYSGLGAAGAAIAAENIRRGYTDLVGWRRQALADPAMAGKVAAGRSSEVNWCVACGECAQLAARGEAVCCSRFPPT